jgi:hypothetical protein
MVGNPYKSRKKNTMEKQESRAHSRGFNLPDDDVESNATEAAVATSAAVKEQLTSVQESVFVELVLSVLRFLAMANTIASFAQKVVEYWNREHFSRMMRGQPGLGGVLPDESAKSGIAAMSDIAVASTGGPESYEPLFFSQPSSRPPPRPQVSIRLAKRKSAPTGKAQEQHPPSAAVGVRTRHNNINHSKKNSLKKITEMVRKRRKSQKCNIHPLK